MNPLLISGPAAIFVTAGVGVYGAVYPRSQLFGSTICRTNSPRRLAITFDDGPNPRITPKLLDLLDRHNVRATFFLIGKFARECPGIVRETAARGHVLANHTYSHPNLFWLGALKMEDELRFCNEALSSVTGAAPKPLGGTGGRETRTAHGHVDTHPGRLARPAGGLADSANGFDRRTCAAIRGGVGQRVTERAGYWRYSVPTRRRA